MKSSRASKPTRIFSRTHLSAPRSCQGYEKPQFETYLAAADTANDKQAEAKHVVEEKNNDLDAAVETGKSGTKKVGGISVFDILKFLIVFFRIFREND
uniref:Uncharacterized protein n=1 Tax=Candidatus Kentrum sp. LFY TaxID=2126342 RepID=A0A450WWU7_9GAMM|nr:MAG: hypothetical protein BECKLFY1418C_GA0070996_109610 [Candidatus Kentron sp. LFY]